jgi:hypothetical protein
MFVTEACSPPPPPGLTLSAMAPDVAATSRFQGNLYFVCNERDGSAVLLTRSSDGGYRWSEPVTVNSLPRDTGVFRQVMGMVVNSRGAVGVTWADRTGATADDIPRPCYEVFFAASVDGGQTFLPAQRVSTRRSCTSRMVNGAAARAWPMGGDYYGLVAAGERFHLVWSETGPGPYQLWTTSIDVSMP